MLKAIEQLDDFGHVYDGDDLLGEYQYHITVFQKMIDAGAGSSIPGLKSIAGRINLDFGTVMKLMMGDPKLRLRLADGRQLEFFFARDDGTITAKGALQ
jgi:hypothetical protein